MVVPAEPVERDEPNRTKLRSMLTGQIPVFRRGDSCHDRDGEGYFDLDTPHRASRRVRIRRFGP